MPELPEVETVRKGLEHMVVGKEIVNIDVFWPRLIEDKMALSEWKKAMSDQTIRQIGRRGKFLLFYLDKGVMTSHLRMEGKYYYIEEGDMRVDKHTHVIFHFKDGSALLYHDVRKFGRFSYVPYEELESYFNHKKLGVEPLTEDFVENIFYSDLQKSASTIKALLLSQKIVVGLGNIYVDEVLFEARIHPQRPANSLTKDESSDLFVAINHVLLEAIRAGGSTIRSYKNTLGELGNFQQNLKVYGKQGDPCPRCQRPIEKIKLAQRGTHFCPVCQR